MKSAPKARKPVPQDEAPPVCSKKPAASIAIEVVRRIAEVATLREAPGNLPAARRSNRFRAETSGPSLPRVAMIGLVSIGSCVVLTKLVAGKSWLESLYHVVITVSSIGYGERSVITPAEQIANMAVILVGMSAFAMTFGVLLRKLLEGEFHKAWGVHRMTKEIESLSGHVILCGFGRIGAMLAQELKRRKVSFVVIDQDAGMLMHARQEDFLVLEGDATTEDALHAAGIDRASTLVTALPSDANNVFIALTARNMNKGLRIIARGEAPETQRKLLQAGADRVILPAAIGAQRIAHMITKPSTIEMLDPGGDQDVLQVEMEEFCVSSTSPLVGQGMSDAVAKNCPGLLWVAVKPESGPIVFKPAAERKVAAHDTLIVMGNPSELEKFGKLTGSWTA